MPLALRVEGLALGVWEAGQWRVFHAGPRIGSQRLVRTEPMMSPKLRRRITKAAADPAMSEAGVFREGLKN